MPRFLESALGRLPGAGEINAPVTMELNGKVAVRATSADRPDQVTELVLTRSGYTGSQVCVCTNRALLERALRLGLHARSASPASSRRGCAGTRGGCTPCSR